MKAEDYPELQLMASERGNVEIGGLMLCAMAAERAAARDEYYRKQAQSQMDSVDNSYMREQHKSMPLFTDRKSDVTRGANFGNGSK